MRIPSLMASSMDRAPRPVMQWVWNSTGIPQAVAGKPLGAKINERIGFDLEGVVRPSPNESQGSLLDGFMDEVQASPRIFLQIAHALLEFGRRHDLDGLESRVVQNGRDRQ